MKRLLLASLLAWAAILFSLPSAVPPAAAQPAIEVLEDRLGTSFPDHVDFLLRARGAFEIREITVYLRFGRSEVENYAYPEFTPGREVDALYELETGGQTYLPAGARIRYRYRIVSASGETLTTEEKAFRYEDTRFSWRSRPQGELTVYWYGDSSVAVHILAVAQEAAQRIEEEAGIALQNPVDIYLYQRKADMDVALPFVSETTRRELITQGQAFPEFDLIYLLASDPEVEGTIAHELSHILTHQATENPYTAPPAWLDEGLAMYAIGPLPENNQRALEAAIASGDLIPLKFMVSLAAKPGQVDLFYGQAASVVSFLVQEYSAEKMSRLLSLLRDGTPLEDALRQAYGFGVEELDARWRQHVGARAATPLALLPSPEAPSAREPEAAAASSATLTYAALLGGVVLLSAAAIIGALLFTRRM